jgi:hypothetical protein
LEHFGVFLSFFLVILGDWCSRCLGMGTGSTTNRQWLGIALLLAVGWKLRIFWWLFERFWSIFELFWSIFGEFWWFFELF